MLVQHILDFIEFFKTEDKFISCDINLIECLLERFSKRSCEEHLTDEDIQFLLTCYKIRWEAIVDRENDYTRNPSSVNLHWIDFARKLEPLTNRNYLKILIPTLTNDKDLNDFSSLNETVNLFNFYLGYGGTTLFRKWSLCEHLKKWQFTLSTYRSLDLRKLSPVTIDELTRLKLCQQTTRQVIVGIETFENFWDFMRRKVFIHLSDNGQIPIGVLPHLLELVERYYYLKSTGSHFSVFKNDVKNFFRRLYSSDLNDINSLYGAKIKYKNGEEYLLDVFIAINSANDTFELDFEMNALSQWLYQYNPALKATSKELEQVYKELARENQTIVARNGQAESLVQCCSLLVSLLTTKFEFGVVYNKSTLNLWDKENIVFPEAVGIFTILLPLIAANRPDAMLVAYGDIIKDIIAPARKDSSWFTWFSRSESTKKWLEHVQNNRLSDLGAYWFEPELIFSALLNFNTNNQSVKSRINSFLDDLIHTYAQDQNDLLKQFRINILFSEFINDLSESHRRNILILIKLSDLKSAKSKFLSNCTLHINDRLTQFGQSQSEGISTHFFSPMRKFDNDKLFILPEGIKDVGAMITEYKTQLVTFNLDKRLFDRISDYLVRKIGRPILTLAQKETAKGSTIFSDYIGQYT